MGFLDDLFKTIPSTTTKTKKTPKVTVPAGFIIPEPKPLTLTRTSDLPSALKSSVALAVRLATSVFVLGWKIDTLFYDKSDDTKYSLQLGPLRIRDTSSVLQTAPRPQKPLILYEYDASPFCKRVRETINLLDLTVEYRPCPGARQSSFSEELFERTGKQTVPYLIDPNTGVEMFESDDQIQYLLDTYGPDKSLYDGKALWPITFKEFSIFTSTIAALVRNMPGSSRQPNARPDNEEMLPLELWGYEASPFVKPVREKLVSLALPHLMVSCSRGSANRDRLIERTGRFQVPFLVDPNTGLELFESPEICEYLDAVYTVKE
jgi:glutathione S-transferase